MPSGMSGVGIIAEGQWVGCTTQAVYYGWGGDGWSLTSGISLALCGGGTDTRDWGLPFPST